MTHSHEVLKDWRETAQLMAMDNIPLELIFKRFPKVSQGTIKHRWLKGLIRNKKLDDIKTKDKIREDFARSLAQNSALTVKDLAAKYHRHPGIVRKYIQDLRPKENEIQYRKEIREYYQSELGKGNTPKISELKKIFNRDKQTIVKCIKNLMPLAPKNGVYERYVNGKKIHYVNLKDLVNLTNYNPYYLRSLSVLKTNRIRLYCNGKYTYYYPVETIFKEYPKLNESFNKLKILLSNKIMYQKPTNLSNKEFMVFIAIIYMQELNVTNDRHPIKPTIRQIIVSLNLYKIGEYDVEKSILTLKCLKYIADNENFFSITRGPKDLLLIKRKCLHPKTGYISNQYCPRTFTVSDWAITEKPTPEEYESTAENKIIFDLMTRNSNCKT